MSTATQQGQSSKPQRAPYVKPVLSPEQVVALQPFLPKLFKRYTQVATTGSSDMADPVCASLKGKSCVECPVWRPNGNAEFTHCSKYLPERPGCVTDNTQAVEFASGCKRGAENLTAAKAWGAAVVAWLESMKEGKQ